MEKQFGKPLTLKGLENGDLGDKRYSIGRLAVSDNFKVIGSIQGKKNAKSSKFKETVKLGGKARGKKCKESGEWDKIRQIGGPLGGKAGGKTTQSIIRTCPHCKKEIKGSVYFTWHGDKCKLKP